MLDNSYDDSEIIPLNYNSSNRALISDWLKCYDYFYIQIDEGHGEFEASLNTRKWGIEVCLHISLVMADDSEIGTIMADT